MSAGLAIARFVARLDAARIPYMIAGSFASMFHGHPRTTYDVDIVIDPDASSLRTLLAALPEAEYYADLDVALDALRHRSQFNVIDLATGWKFDLIVRKPRPFSIEEFRRRVPATIAGTAVVAATAEDVIIAKLEWSRMSASERQLQDVAGILAVRAGTLDLAYVERWVAELDLAAEWARVRSG